MEIVVNGEAATVPGGITIAGLLERLELDPARVAVELDRHIIRTAEWQRTALSPGAKLEIVQFVGGG